VLGCDPWYLSHLQHDGLLQPRASELLRRAGEVVLRAVDHRADLGRDIRRVGPEFASWSSSLTETYS
jgi:hypothetical protein